MTRRITYLIIAAASLLMTACSVFDDHMYGPDGEQKVRVSFVLALGSSDTPVTKTETWDPNDPTDDADNIGYNPKAIGDSYDNMIDPGTLQVVFYENSTDGALVGQVTIRNYFPVDSQGNRIDTDAEGLMPEDKVSNLYYFEGDLLADENILKSATDYKMMVFANMPDSQRTIVSGSTSLSDIQNLTFTRFAIRDKTRDTEFIPMWGVKTVTLNLQPGETQDLETIYVLRAMAKVEVKLSSNLLEAGYTLTEMNMSNTNGTGYVLPTGAAEKSATETMNLQTCFNELSLSEYVAPAVTSDGGKSSLVMYVPEKDNRNNASEIGITLKYSSGSAPQTISPDATIKFTKYTLGKPSEDVADIYNIVRNHNYVFEINSISSDGLKFIVTVKDLELGGVFGFIYDQEQN